jgi:hypothetical protein
VRDHDFDARPFTIVVFCRAGEKRSVGFGSFTAAMLRDYYGVRCETDHLSQYYWSRKTCAGNNCDECGDPGRLQVIHESAIRRTGWRQAVGARG